MRSRSVRKHVTNGLLALAAPLECGDRRRQTPAARGSVEGRRDLVRDEPEELELFRRIRSRPPAREDEHAEEPVAHKERQRAE